jgi:hypothetical protein
MENLSNNQRSFSSIQRARLRFFCGRAELYFRGSIGREFQGESTTLLSSTPGFIPFDSKLKGNSGCRQTWVLLDKSLTIFPCIGQSVRILILMKEMVTCMTAL